MNQDQLDWGVKAVIALTAVVTALRTWKMPTKLQNIEVHMDGRLTELLEVTRQLATADERARGAKKAAELAEAEKPLSETSAYYADRAEALGHGQTGETK